jgi:prephenate dehydrogenase
VSPALPATVLVIGTGLIGTSVALGLRRQGVAVWLQDADPEVARAAEARGAGRTGEPDVDVDLVMVAVPPARAASVISEALRLNLFATVSDVVSTKAELLREVERLVQDSSDLARYVPGHPLAGREVSGPEAAREDLFVDRVWALTPGPATDGTRVRSMEAVVAALGALPVRTTAEAHDAAVALTSHTPQVVSSAVAAGLAQLGEVEVGLSGQGLRDVTRLAESDADLWTEILTSNAVPVADALAGVVVRLEQVRAALLSPTPDAEAVRSALVAGGAGRSRVAGKHGGAPVRWAVVPVAVADRPGELGRLFADAGATGVNLEDVRIEHAQGRPTGLVELEVAPESARALADGLRAAGWSVRG